MRGIFGLDPGWGIGVVYVKVPAQWWNPARIDLMLLVAGLLLVLAGPGRLGLDELWLERDG